MASDATLTPPRSRDTPRRKRLLAAVTAAMVAGYLGVINVAWQDELGVPYRWSILLGLWALGLLALGVLGRVYRRAGRPAAAAPDGPAGGS